MSAIRGAARAPLTAVIVDLAESYSSASSIFVQVKDFLGELSAKGKLSRNTLRLILCTLRVILNHAVEDGVLEHNPAEKLGRFTRTENPLRYILVQHNCGYGKFTTPKTFKTSKAGTVLDPSSNLFHYHFLPCLEHAGL
jgi:hypothetical protein